MAGVTTKARTREMPSTESLPQLVEFVEGAYGHIVFGVDGTCVAIWQLTPSGRPSNAWRIDDLDSLSPERARGLLGGMERRLVSGTADHRERDLRVLDVLAARAEVVVPEVYSEAWLDLALVERFVAVEREAMAEGVRHQQTRATSKLATLSYDLDLPRCPAGSDLATLLTAYRIRPRPGRTAEVGEALQQAQVLAAAGDLWRDTEVSRMRRKYLRPPAGPAVRVIAPAWLDCHLKVSATPFDFSVTPLVEG
ncbi:DUF6218 family protein [Kineococcus sp. LSe6-4]|uniref:DUF6218 family protein n=1 Tax=Kineococcus halophytocola TaxID=3234027 RepID=A0ABV4GYZ7_9ACTN